MSRFWTSDLHFDHNNIVKHTDRKLAVTQEEHDEWLTNLINKQVNPKDSVIHLGDFCFKHSLTRLHELSDRLNGIWTFIVGNHDDELLLKAAFGEHRVWYMARTTINKHKVELCHYPWGSWRSQHHGSWHLHGHCHGNYIRRNEGRILDVGLDSAFNIYGEHRLFSDADVEAYMADRPIYVSDHHKEKTHEPAS